MNWGHSPPRSSTSFFRFLFALSSVFVFVAEPLAATRTLSAVLCRDCLPPPLRVSSLVPEVLLPKSRNAKSLLLASLVLLVGSSSFAQSPTAPKKPPAGPPAPQSKHYPILLLALGNDPSWSLRIGQKGPERLDRPAYPPITLACRSHSRRHRRLLDLSRKGHRHWCPPFRSPHARTLYRFRLRHEIQFPRRRRPRAARHAQWLRPHRRRTLSQNRQPGKPIR